MKAFTGVCLFISLTIVLAVAGSAPPSKLERGKYLVDHVAMCGDCHTPRNEKGELIQEKYLKGTPLSFKPTAPVPAWADKAPNIAGLPGWEEKDAIKFLMTGLAYNDLPGRPPMPQFRFNQEDASAVVAYLRSLGLEGKGSGQQK